MSSKISCRRCGGCGMVPQSGENCVDCLGSGRRPWVEIEGYIDGLEQTVSRHKSETNGESGRLDSSNAEVERDAANEYATEAKEENKKLSSQLASKTQECVALAIKAVGVQKFFDIRGYGHARFCPEHYGEGCSPNSCGYENLLKILDLPTSSKQIVEDHDKKVRAEGISYVLGLAQCRCTHPERLSGHLVGCWWIECEAEEVRLKAKDSGR